MARQVTGPNYAIHPTNQRAGRDERRAVQRLRRREAIPIAAMAAIRPKNPLPTGAAPAEHPPLVTEPPVPEVLPVPSVPTGG